MSPACSLIRHRATFSDLGSSTSMSPELNHDGRLTGVDRGGRPLRRLTRSTAIIVRSGRPPRRLAVPAIRSYEQTDRPRPSRSRSGPGGQHGRDRPDWRRVVHRPADLKKVISSIARPSMMAGRRPNKHAGDMFWAGLSTLLAPLAAFSERGVKMAVFHGPQAQSWRCRYFVPASILLRKRSASLEPHRRGHFGAEFANLLGSAG